MDTLRYKPVKTGMNERNLDPKVKILLVAMRGDPM